MIYYITIDRKEIIIFCTQSPNDCVTCFSIEKNNQVRFLVFHLIIFEQMYVYLDF